MSAFAKEIRDFGRFLETFERRGGSVEEAITTYLAGLCLSTADRVDLGAQLRARIQRQEEAGEARAA